MDVPEDMTAYLLVDTFAFERLALQRECRVGLRNALMAGYETYLIEQWACERKVNTVVASYTGNQRHVVKVQVLFVPKNLSQWSTTTFSHFEELMKMHILPKETSLGSMLVTSLSSLPTNLTLVGMAQDFREGYSRFVVNENLRRLHVVGRIAVTAEPPSESCVASLCRNFALSSVPSVEYAAQELVTLMQIALFYFGLLDAEHVDGLLCDYTIQAIDTWWHTVGRSRYRTFVAPRPQEKFFMRTTCAALVGIITGARQRFSALGLKPPKDPFDPEEFVVCIRRFQKTFKIPRTAILDNTTYAKLLTVTEKNSSIGNNTNNVLTLMKSTVKEGISGKVAEAVDDWETLDIEVLARNVRGERCKYLWQGKGEPCVCHLRASLSVKNVGEHTKIPLFSLPNVDPRLDLQQPQDQHLHHTTPQRGHFHHHHHHYPHANPQSSASMARGSNASASPGPGNLPHVDSPMSSSLSLTPRKRPGQATPDRNQSADSLASTQNHIDAECHDEKCRTASQTESPEHRSLVDRFRRRYGHKPALAEPFDDQQQPPTHTRHHSVSSDHWFVQHHNDVPPNSLEQTAVLEEDEPDAKQLPPDKTSSTEPTIKPDFWALVKPSTLLTKDDLALDREAERQFENGYDSRLNSLRRTASLSSLEEVVFPYDGLAPLPEIMDLYAKNQSLQSQLKSQIHNELSIKQELSGRVASNESAVADVIRDNMVIKYHVSATKKKDEAARRRLGELEAFMARLDYELATLTAKLNDIDQSVVAFAAKVDSSDAKWSQMKKEPSQSWWTRWLGSMNIIRSIHS